MVKNRIDYKLYQDFENEYEKCITDARSELNKEDNLDHEIARLNGWQRHTFGCTIALVVSSILLYFSNVVSCITYTVITMILLLLMMVLSVIGFFKSHKYYKDLYSDEREAVFASLRLSKMTQYFVLRNILNESGVRSFIEHYERIRDDGKSSGEKLEKLITAIGIAGSTIVTVFMKDSIINVINSEQIATSVKDIILWLIVIVLEIPIMASVAGTWYFQKVWPYSRYTMLEDLYMLLQNLEAGTIDMEASDA